MNDEVQMIPIDQIRVVNPRHRDQKKFALIVQSIRNLVLKKPIQVRPRPPKEAKDGKEYDLICGQGRIEACRSLGFTQIPAIVVEVTEDECLLMSLVENMARRFTSPLTMMNEINRLKELGYSNVEIGKKLDVPDTTVGGYLALQKAGEERLLDAAMCGRIPLGVAMDIARTDGVETQRELLKAYESKQLNLLSIRTVKRLMQQRRFMGKQREPGRRQRKALTSAESLVNAYRKESQRQKLVIKKARVCDEKLVFIVSAMSKLLADEHFVTLLKAENLFTMPKHLWAQVQSKRKEGS